MRACVDSSSVIQCYEKEWQMQEDWLTGLNVDLGLMEVRDDVDEQWERRALAGASVGVDPQSALTRAHELASAIDLLIAGSPLGKIGLAGILSSDENDYQRCLWYALAGRHPFSVATDVRWLVGLLRARAEQWAQAIETGRQVTKAPSPYVSDRADGPVGDFAADFALGPQWEGIAEGVRCSGI